MKFPLLAIVLIAATGIQAQDSKPFPKLLIGYSFSPDYCSRTLKNKDGSAMSDVIIDVRNDAELGKFGYTMALNIGVGLSKTTTIETGLQFTNKGFRTRDLPVVTFPVDPNLPDWVKTVYSYQYIGIPLKARFAFGNNKFRFLTGIGFTTNFLLNVKSTMTLKYSDGHTEKNKESSSSGYNKIDLSPMINIGVDYKLNNKVYLFAEPTFRYGVINITDSPVTGNLWSAGVNVGFYCRIK